MKRRRSAKGHRCFDKHYGQRLLSRRFFCPAASAAPRGVGEGGMTLRKKLNAALGYDPILNRIGEGYLIDEPKD